MKKIKLSEYDRLILQLEIIRNQLVKTICEVDGRINYLNQLKRRGKWKMKL